MPKRLENYKNYFIDINSGIARRRAFGGYNGIKMQWNYQNKIYMIKRQEKNPSHKRHFLNLKSDIIKSYNNSILSEYVSSNLINFIKFSNLKAQNTFLVKDENETSRIRFWVACEHVSENYNPQHRFITFSQLNEVMGVEKNLSEANSRNHDNIKFYDIVEWIKNDQNIFNKKEFLQYFYDMFIIDAFLMNWDRNPTNWGFNFYDDENNNEKVYFAPLIDHGSTLFSKYDNEAFELFCDESFDNKIEHLIKSTRSFFLDDNGQKINYLNWIKNTNDELMLERINLFINLKLDLKYFVENLNLPSDYKKDYLYLISKSFELIKQQTILNKNYQKKFYAQ